MKRWALVVVALYFLILVVLPVPLVLVAFVPQVSLKDTATGGVSWSWLVWPGVMALAQAALLVVPVRVASRRPVARRSLLWPVLTAGLMMSGLAAGVLLCLFEFARQDRGAPEWFWRAALASAVVFWLVWAVVFYRSSRAAAPADVVSRQCRLMFRGSILELLIAVPTHIVARNRDYCCAGFGTFVGLALGISVMLFSFRPAVFFLYAERWRRLRPERASELEQSV